MKIIGFPVDVSRSHDGRIVRGLRTRQSLIQATLDLIQAGDVEPTSAAIATIAGVSSRALFQHFTSLADLYDPEAMPADLRAAHERNDEVLERIYIGRRFKNDTERLEKLFELYTKMTGTRAA